MILKITTKRDKRFFYILLSYKNKRIYYSISADLVKRNLGSIDALGLNINV